jgi:ribosomal protein L37E
MAIIDQELFVRCERCGNEAATGIRRTEEGLREMPPGRRRIQCHRCGRAADYDGPAFYHRTVEADRARVDA